MKNNTSDKLFLYGWITAAALGLIGLFVRPESGVDAMPGFYPLTAIVIIIAAVLVVRGLTRVLERPEDEYDAD